MPQVLKAATREAIAASALRLFADQGFPGTSMAQIAAAAGTATGNVYRYFPSKQALLDAVLPADLPARHDALLDARVAALAGGTADGPAAASLLDFWLDRRLAMVVLLDRAAGTPFDGYPRSFVDRLVAHVEQSLDGSLPDLHRDVLTMVFDNTRRTLAQILRTAQEREHAQELITAFWSYQVPGVNGLLAHLRRRETAVVAGAPPAR